MKRFHHGKKPESSVRKAEIKILTIVIYYIIMGTATLSTTTYFLATNDETAEEFQVYFSCQSFGIVPGKDCGDPPNIQLQPFSILATVSYFLLGLLPTVILIFTKNCNCFNSCINKFKSKKSKANLAQTQMSHCMKAEFK